MQQAKNIFLTGATGIMGFEGLTQLLTKTEHNLILLVLPTKKNKKKLHSLNNNKRVKIIWGDLRNYEKVLECVSFADYVLHVGGMVSPKADKYPEKTMDVNINAVKNIVKAIKAQAEPDRIKLLYVGSIAEYGNKQSPDLYCCVKDTLAPALFDSYAVSKIIAEKIITESGIKHWVSLRQSGILYPSLPKKGINPITFHVVLRGVIEWATVEDSGNLLVQICSENVPESFWRNFYNISSGNSYRLSNYEFECKLLNAIHCPPPEKIFDTNWFALKNFHGGYYSDADVLENILHFRNNILCDDYFALIKKKTPWYFGLAVLAPSRLIRYVMKKIAYSANTGTMSWIRDNNLEKIKAYFGSIEDWEAIPAWDKFDKSHPSENLPEPKNYGNCFNKPETEWDLTDMQQAAVIRNGKCLASSMNKGDIDTPLLWLNADNVEFYATPRYVLHGGYFPSARLVEEEKNFFNKK